jgi:hypothetical protein
MESLKVVNVPVREKKNEAVLELLKLHPPQSAPPKKRKRRSIWRVVAKAALGVFEAFSVRSSMTMFRERGPGLPPERIENHRLERRF